MGGDLSLGISLGLEFVQRSVGVAPQAHVGVVQGYLAASAVVAQGDDVVVGVQCLGQVAERAIAIAQGVIEGVGDGYQLPLAVTDADAFLAQGVSDCRGQAVVVKVAGFGLRVGFGGDAIEQVIIVGGKVDRVTDVVRATHTLDPPKVVVFSVYADSAVVEACSLAADFAVEFVEIKDAGRRAGFAFATDTHTHT